MYYCEDREDKKSKKNIYAILKRPEHINDNGDSVVLGFVVEEFLVHIYLIVLEDILIPGDIVVETCIRGNVHIRDFDTIREGIFISFFNKISKVWIASSKDSKSILTRNIRERYTRKSRTNLSHEIPRSRVIGVVFITKINRHRDAVVHAGDKLLCREEDKEKNIYKKYQETDNKDGRYREKEIAEDIFECVAEDIHR